MATPPGQEAQVAAGGAVRSDRVRLESDTLYSVISVVASSPDLNRVLGGIVDLLTEATDCHACFVYLREADRLVMRSASRIYGHLVGRIEMGIDEGLTGWVARHKTPAFIRDKAMADPRMKYIPEIEEEHFQSMVAVPVPARSGDVNAVIVLHTRAPREFGPEVMNFLAHTASLVAGAIENAQLYEDSRRRVAMLTGLSDLGQQIASVSSREALYAIVCGGVRTLLDCDACSLYLLDGDGRQLEIGASDPPGQSPALLSDGTSVLLDLLRRRASGRLDVGPGGGGASLVAPVAAGDENLGVLAIEGAAVGDEQDELLRAIAQQAALALQKVRLIERLTAENIVRDLFTALEEGRRDVAEDRARTAGCDLARAHVVIHAEPRVEGDDGRPWPTVAESAEAHLRILAPGAVIDAAPAALRALLPLPPRTDGQALEAALHALARGEGLFLGISTSRPGVTDGRRSLSEAVDAATIARALMAEAGGALAYRDLGAYRYLVRVPPDESPDDRHRVAVDTLIDYDRQRRAQLVPTLEQYLRDRSRVATARALYIHPNTLRQRLERIEALSQLDLDTEDLVSLELALKLARLRAAR